MSQVQIYYRKVKKPKDQNSFSCKWNCGVIKPTKAEIIAHQEKKHMKEYYVCPICKKILTRLRYIKEHIHIDHRKDPDQYMTTTLDKDRVPARLKPEIERQSRQIKEFMLH